MSMMLPMGKDTDNSPNVLHKRNQQVLRWNNSDANKESVMCKDASKVNFPMTVKFLAACSSNDTNEIKSLLEEGIDINVQNIDGLTALHQACIDNDLELVQFLILHGADVDVQDNEGWTPLHATASCGYMEVAKHLIKSGAKLGVASFDGELALDVAQGDEMTHFLREEMALRNIDPEVCRRVEEAAMLADARHWLETGHYNAVLDTRTRASPLHVAASKDYVSVMEVLLRTPGVDVDAPDSDGWTPLHAAAHWGKENACRMLIAEGNASMDVLTAANQTVFDVADEDLIMLLRQLREQQRVARFAAKSDSVLIRHDQNKRRSSVTRMSNDEKQTVLQKTLAEEREKLGQLGLITGNRDIEEEEEDRLHTPRPPPQVINGAIAPEEHVTLPPQSTTVAESGTELVAVPLAPPATTEPTTITTTESVRKVSPTSAPSPATPLENSNNTVLLRRSLGDTELLRDQQRRVGFLNSDDHRAPPTPSSVSVTPTSGAALAQDQATRETSPSYVPLADQDCNLLSLRRVSAVMAPSKAEETETQRSVKARHIRSVRRSTQGVTPEEIEEAKKLTEQQQQVAVPATSEDMSKGNRAAPTPGSTMSSTRLHQTDGLMSGATDRTELHVSTPSLRQGRHQQSLVGEQGSAAVTTSSSRAPLATYESEEDHPPLHQQVHAEPTLPTAVAATGDKPGTEYLSVRRRTRDRVPTGVVSKETVETAAASLVAPATVALPAPPLTGSTGDSLSYGQDTARSRQQQSQPDVTTVTHPPDVTTGRPGRVSTTNNVTLVRPQSVVEPVSGGGWRREVPGSVPSVRAPIDYRLLFEEEKSDRERLKRELDQLHRDLHQLRLAAASEGSGRGRSGPSPDTCSPVATTAAGSGEINRLRDENARLKEENQALIRVISKLSK